MLQVPVPSAYRGSRLWIQLTLQTLHLVSGAKYPLILFTGFTFRTTVLFCVAHSLATTSLQSQRHRKPAWSRLLTCMPWRTPSRTLPQHQETQEAGMQMEEYLCSCNKRLHVLACLSKTWLRREPHARMTWLEWPSRCMLISTTRFRCNYRNNCKHYAKTILQMTLHR